MWSVVIFGGIIAVVVIREIAHKIRHEENEVAKGCLISILTVFVIFALLLGYTFYNVGRFIKSDLKWNDQSDMSAVDKERWSYYVALPEAEHCFEYYAIRGLYDPKYMVETRAYNSVEEMCADLPEGCEKAISAALNGKPQDEEDVHGVDVKQYKVSNELLPLISESEVQTRYGWYSLGAPRYYCIDEYEDGTFRFTVQYVVP